MPRFDRNDVSLMQKEIRKNVQHPKIGKVDEIFEHGNKDDDSNFEANVIVDGELEQECPILNPGNDAIDIPMVGDKVLLIYTDEKNKKPFVTDTVWTNKDRPPVGKTGMYRRKFAINKSKNPSPSGAGDIFVNGYTKYDKKPFNKNKGELTPERAVYQIAKHKKDSNFIPTEQEEVPAKIEMYDAPKDDASHIHIDANKIDSQAFGDKLGLDIFLNLKTGKLHIRGENDNAPGEYEFVLDVKNKTAKIIGDSAAQNKMGASFNFGTNEFSIADGNKFGITSDGSGNFTWEHKSINFKEISGSSGNISI